VGDSPAFRRSLDHARRAAATSSTVLITGESGTGKELIARLVHALSARRDEPFVAVHCAALPEALMESELFGYERGAFTGATQRKLGRFDMAGSGTLFFDEVGETSNDTQVKLLRVLQEREFMRVGGTNVIRTNARIICASHRNLRIAVREGKFREDLFYRLSVVPIELPPLRERRDDIPVLARYFLEYFRQSMDVATEDFEPRAMELLCRYGWPGNIRELRNMIERLLVLNRGARRIRVEFLPEEVGRPPRPRPVVEQRHTLTEAVNEFERHLVEDALSRADGVQTRAAELLGTTRRKLKYRMEKLNIEYHERPAESSRPT
jgi:transcriptional regulator with GAF, ATPase, and Fis domain